jgi:hypothetical protein
MNGWLTLALYVAAGAVYIAICVFFPRLVLSWVEGAVFLLLGVVVVPMLIGRLRR